MKNKKNTKTKKIKIVKKEKLFFKDNQILFSSFIFTLILVLLALFFMLKSFSLGMDYVNSIYLNNQDNVIHNEALIGGQKDAGGCLVGAGYSWCEAKQKCLRVWEEPCVASTDAEKISVLKKYLEENISNLSPVKEVVGGKFYITEVNSLSATSAFIGYEDGHISYNAEISYSIGDDGIVKVDKFLVKNKNGQKYDLTACNKSSDCVPLPSECHPHACINKSFIKDFVKPEVCTMMFDTSAAYEAKDCGCGLDNICFDRNLSK